MHNIRSPSEASQTSGFDERSLDSAIQSPLRWVIEIDIFEGGEMGEGAFWAGEEIEGVINVGQERRLRWVILGK